MSIYTKLSKCRQKGDTSSEEVSRRISLSIDLVVKDPICHQQCKSDFLRMKDISGHGQSRKTPRRPSNKPMVEFFGTFCKWLNGQTELDTIFEQNEKLKTFAENDYVYSIKWPKKRAERKRFHVLC